jgi:hypothetical protein
MVGFTTSETRVPRISAAGEWRILKLELSLPVGAELGSTSALLSETVENGVQAFNFHVVHHLKKNSQSARRKSALGGEPRKIFERKVKDGNPVWWVVRRTVLSKGHASPPDLLEVALHLVRHFVHSVPCLSPRGEGLPGCSE